jgi:hypothetical protein
VRLFGASGQPLSIYGQPNEITLQAGETYLFNSNLNPQVPGQGTGNAGWSTCVPGRYTNVQVLDPITGIWRAIGDNSNATRWFYSDGANYRLANQSGCAVAATVTTAGSAYVSVPTVVASAGSSKWLAVLGPLVSTSVTVTYGGTNYVYPPFVRIDPPPAGGVCATGYATLSGAVVSSVTITNQGAGYSGGTPNIYFVNDPRDTAGSGATATVALTGAQTVAAVLCVDHGNPITSGTVPTLTFGSGSAAATVLMNWGVQTYGVTTAGAGYANSSFVAMTAIGPALVANPSYTNPDIQDNLVRVRNANIWVTTGASTGPLTTGGVIVDGGVYRGIPTQIISSSTAPSTVGVLSLTMGGFNDTSFITPG